MGFPLAATNLSWIDLGIGLLGGLAVFLFGMGQLTDGLKSVAGEGMRALLAKLTRNRFMGAVTGAFVTAVIQSSSVTTVLTVGFISAGLMTLPQAVGVIMGANVGTTITAQIVAFKITEYSLLLVAAGFGLLFLSKQEKIRQTGTMIMGLGMIFLGMGLMSEAANPLRDFKPFIQIMQGLDRPILGLLCGAVFTALVQSSSATTGIVIVLASQGFITLEAGIAIVLGSNVGTCVTALFAALGKPRTAFQAALVHVLFNLLGVLLWVGFIDILAEFVRSISPVAQGLEGTARLQSETPRQIANAHTVFNVANTILFIGFAGVFARVVETLLPARPETDDDRARPRYLDEAYLETPALAIDRLRLEVARLGAHVVHAVRGIGTGESPATASFEGVKASIREVRQLHWSIVDYARDLLRADLSRTESHRLEQILEVANHLNSLGDTLELNLLTRMQSAEAGEERASPETRERLRAIYREVAEAIANSVEAVRDRDLEMAKDVIARKREITRQADALVRALTIKLGAADSGRITIYRLEMEIIEVIKRLYYFAKRIAKTMVESEETGEIEDPTAALSASPIGEHIHVDTPDEPPQ